MRVNTVIGCLTHCRSFPAVTAHARTLVHSQVSHHPPASAMHAETCDWQYWQDYTMSSKFRGKYLQILPQGIAHLMFRGSGNHYTCSKVTTTIHNIIVGKLWVDQSGEATIVNHKTGDYCHLKYYPYSYFSKELPRRVSCCGCVFGK